MISLSLAVKNVLPVLVCSAISFAEKMCINFILKNEINAQSLLKCWLLHWAGVLCVKQLFMKLQSFWREWRCWRWCPSTLTTKQVNKIIIDLSWYHYQLIRLLLNNVFLMFLAMVAKSLPKLLNLDQKQWMDIAQQLLNEAENYPELLKGARTGEETWVHVYDNETTTQWRAKTENNQLWTFFSLFPSIFMILLFLWWRGLYVPAVWSYG